MKIIISENQKKNLLKSIVKKHGWEYASKLAGKPEELAKLTFDNDPMEFLHMFNDMDFVQSKSEKDWTLYRYEKGHNLMIYDRKNKYVYIDYSDIWLFLEDGFGLNYSETQELTTRWVDEAYNLRGVTTRFGLVQQKMVVDEAYNLRGVTITPQVPHKYPTSTPKWMNHTN
jgi:hypothetical protein